MRGKPHARPRLTRAEKEVIIQQMLPSDEADIDLSKVELIVLTRGLFTLVDEDDYEWLNGFSWYAKPNKKSFNAAMTVFAAPDNICTVRMHQLIMGLQLKKVIDHRNNNPLDNRRNNLRICTQGQNLCNYRQDAFKGNDATSIYKGVYKNGKKWRVVVSFQRVRHFVGDFTTEIEAAKAYNKKALELHGEFAKLNKI
jgi:hypothetical protein